MITVFIRMIIMMIGIGVMASYAGAHEAGVYGAIVMLCLWLSVKRLHMIIWWVVGFSGIVALMHVHHEVAVFLIMLCAAYAFDGVRQYLIRSNNTSRVWYFGTTVVVAFVGFAILTIGTPYFMMTTMHTYLGGLFFTGCVFFLCDYIVRRLERFNDLYTHGGDLRCHT